MLPFHEAILPTLSLSLSLSSFLPLSPLSFATPSRSIGEMVPQFLSPILSPLGSGGGIFTIIVTSAKLTVANWRHLSCRTRSQDQKKKFCFLSDEKSKTPITLEGEIYERQKIKHFHFLCVFHQKLLKCKEFQKWIFIWKKEERSTKPTDKTILPWSGSEPTNSGSRAECSNH